MYMKKLVLSIILCLFAFDSICQSNMSSQLFNLNNFGVSNIAVGVNGSLNNKNNSLIVGTVMYRSYELDTNAILNSIEIDEFDQEFDFKIKHLSTFLNELDITSINTNDFLDIVIKRGVYKFKNDLNIPDGSILKINGDTSDQVVVNVYGDLIIGNNSAIQLDGIRPENIYWNVHGKIVIGDMVESYGMFISDSSISLGENNYGGKILLSRNKITLSEYNQDITSYENLKLITASVYNIVNLNNCNLVNNYSFEAKSKCPDGSGKIGYAQFWSNAGTTSQSYSGSDLLGCEYPIPYYGATNNDFGSEVPRTGYMMGGEYIFSNKTTSSSTGYREFMCNELKKNINSGEVIQS